MEPKNWEIWTKNEGRAPPPPPPPHTKKKKTTPHHQKKIKKKKNFADFQKKIREFSKFSKIDFWWRQIFENLIIHKPSLGSRDVPQKIWARSVQPFWRLLDTNGQTDRQTDRQAKFIYRRWNVCILYMFTGSVLYNMIKF